LNREINGGVVMFVDFFTKPNNYLVVLAGLTLCACSSMETKSDQQLFEYLSVDGNTIRTVHGLKYQMQADESFKTADARHRTDTFFDVPFEISLSAFIRKDAAIIIHAERVTDGSGASDYSGLGASDWPNTNFRTDGA
jgi:hypothetical protein